MKNNSHNQITNIDALYYLSSLTNLTQLEIRLQ